MTVSEHRRCGYAEEVATALLEWVAKDGGAREVVASVDPANDASIGLLAKLGFCADSRYCHEVRGEQLLFCLGIGEPA
jgi:RimJ/RimL family protein N-acetyltransferase